MRWSRRKYEMCFKQAYTHVRQFVSKSGLHKVAFFFFSFILSLQLYIYMYVVLSHLQLVPSMLTNAIIKWEGKLGEGQTHTSNWTAKERKANGKEQRQQHQIEGIKEAVVQFIMKKNVLRWIPNTVYYCTTLNLSNLLWITRKIRLVTMDENV